MVSMLVGQRTSSNRYRPQSLLLYYMGATLHLHPGR